MYANVRCNYLVYLHIYECMYCTYMFYVFVYVLMLVDIVCLCVDAIICMSEYALMT
jgi:hypothetical protein